MASRLAALSVLCLASSLVEAAQPWSVNVGDMKFSQDDDISNYYFAFGPDAVISPELLEQRVFSNKWGHIFRITKDAARVASDSKSWESKFDDWKLTGLVAVEDGAFMASELPEAVVESTYDSGMSPSLEAEEERLVETVLDADSYMSYLEELTNVNVEANGIPSRDVFNRAATLEAQALMKKKFEDMGYFAFVQEFEFAARDQDFSGQMFPSGNVIACKPGKTHHTFTISGHLDSRGGYNQTDTSSPSTPATTDAWAPGANDDGSGSSAVLEFARAFATSEVQTEKSMFFIGYGAEEQGLHGSRHWVAELLNETSTLIPAQCLGLDNSKKQTHENIQMDMIGYAKDPTIIPTVVLETCMRPGAATGAFGAIGDATCPEDRPDSTYLVAHQAASSKKYNGDTMKVLFDSGVGGSDHVPYLENGLQAVQTIDVDFSNYDCYHKSCDTIANGVEKNYVHKILKMNLGAAFRVAHNAENHGSMYDMPAALGKFYVGDVGTECPVQHLVSTAELCHEGIMQLNLTVGEVDDMWTGNYQLMPKGCSHRADAPNGSPHGFFNSVANGAPSAIRSPICFERQSRYYLEAPGQQCPEDMGIASETECAQAMFHLELKQNRLWTGKSSTKPAGCSYREGSMNDRLAHGRWNTHGTGGLDSHSLSICKSALIADPIDGDCPWTTGTTRYEMVLQCMDGHLCIGWSCCVDPPHGGRARCPLGYTNMCAQPNQCGGGRDYCCSGGDCAGSGGIRGCNSTNP